VRHEKQSVAASRRSRGGGRLSGAAVVGVLRRWPASGWHVLELPAKGVAVARFHTTPVAESFGRANRAVAKSLYNYITTLLYRGATQPAKVRILTPVAALPAASRSLRLRPARYHAVAQRTQTIITSVVVAILVLNRFRAQTMARFSSFLLGLCTGAMILYVVMNYHVVRAHDGFHVVNKQPPRMSESYVDIRSFSTTDWAGRPQLTSAIVNGNQQRLLGDSASASLEKGINQVEGLVPSWPESSSPE
jgi:hypothetical protein